MRARILAVLALASSFLIPAPRVSAQSGAGAWEVQLHRGIPYLTVEAIQRNYGFTDLTTDAERFELKSASALLQGREGASSILVNRLRYDLHFPIENQNGRCLISAYDVTNLIDFMLRPTDHLQARELQTVYLQDAGNELSVTPVAAGVVLSLQEALRSFGIEVRLLSEGADELPEASWRDGPTGATIWLRLKGNAKLPAHSIRCGILSPPESPKRNGAPGDAARRVVHTGNLYDAESLAFATLLQSGFVFGPGAKTEKIIDGGVGQDAEGAFQRSSGAAALVEWGSEFPEEHLLKSIAAGVVRYQGFLKGLRERQEAAAEGGRTAFTLGPIELHQGSGPPELRFQIRARDGAVPPAGIPVQELELQFYLFSGKAGRVELLSTPPDKILAEKLIKPDAVPGSVLDLAYVLPEVIQNRAGEPDFGWVVRLVWQGKVQDSEAAPRGLLNQLKRFTSLYP